MVYEKSQGKSNYQMKVLIRTLCHLVSSLILKCYDQGLVIQRKETICLIWQRYIARILKIFYYWEDYEDTVTYVIHVLTPISPKRITQIAQIFKHFNFQRCIVKFCFFQNWLRGPKNGLANCWQVIQKKFKTSNIHRQTNRQTQTLSDKHIHFFPNSGHLISKYRLQKHLFQ